MLSLEGATSHACIEDVKSGRTVPSLALFQIAPSTPPALVRLVNRCLAIEASLRPPDADAVADECGKFLSSKEREPRAGKRGAFARLLGGLFGRKDGAQSKFVRRG